LLCNLPDEGQLVHNLFTFRDPKTKKANPLGILTNDETEQQHWVQVNGQLNTVQFPKNEDRKLGFSIFN